MPSGSITRRTLTSYLDDYLQRGSAIVFVDRRGLRYVRWSYTQLVLTARRTARELQSRGIPKGERILLCGENGPEWVAVFWGCILHGSIVVPLDKDITAEFAIAVQQQTEAKLIFASSSVTFIERLNLPVICLDQLTDTVAVHSAEPYLFDEVDESSLVEIVFTSGTTSTPKGVLITDRNLLANLLPMEREIAKYLKWEQFFHPTRFLNLVPLSHVFGQFMGVFVPQLLGGEVHFHDSLNPAEVVRRTHESRISVIVLVPRMLDSLREWIRRTQATGPDFEEKFQRAPQIKFLRRWWVFRKIHRLFGWKFWAFVSGGATLDERTETFWRRLGFAVLQGYGMTETASLITVTHPFKAGHGSVGKLMPGYEVKLDEAGEIVVRGESVSPGYWTSAGQTDRGADEWFHTGDIGTVDEAGNLFFKGRKRDVIVTAAGLNIYPEDLEAALNRQPEVQTSCVIGLDESSGTDPVQPLAVIILRDSSDSAAAAVERANEGLAEYQRIRLWHVWTEPDFPRTATHKVLKREVAAQIKDEGGRMKDEGGRMKDEGGRSEDEVKDEITRFSSLIPYPSSLQSSLIPHPSSLHSSLPSSFILSTAARISGHAQPSEDNPSLKLTTDLKLDSLGRIELLSALEERYQIEIDEAAFTGATTVADVERIVRGEISETGASYPYPKWSRRFPVTWLRAVLFYTIILPITHVMSRMRVAGQQHVAQLNGPVLFVANHVTLADHALILAALPFRLRHRLAIAMEGEHLRDWLHPPPDTNWLMRLRQLAQYILVTTFFHVFPLPKQSGFRRAFAYAGECVDRGESVLVFPEGMRAPRGQMNMSAFRGGTGLLAKELNIPVVPVKLNGLYELKRRRQYFAPPGMVSVVFGEPIRFEQRLEPAAIAEELQRRVDAL